MIVIYSRVPIGTSCLLPKYKDFKKQRASSLHETMDMMEPGEFGRRDSDDEISTPSSNNVSSASQQLQEDLKLTPSRAKCLPQYPLKFFKRQQEIEDAYEYKLVVGKSKKDNHPASIYLYPNPATGTENQRSPQMQLRTCDDNSDLGDPIDFKDYQTISLDAPFSLVASEGQFRALVKFYFLLGHRSGHIENVPPIPLNTTLLDYLSKACRDIRAKTEEGDGLFHPNSRAAATPTRKYRIPSPTLPSRGHVFRESRASNMKSNMPSTASDPFTSDTGPDTVFNSRPPSPTHSVRSMGPPSSVRKRKTTAGFGDHPVRKKTSRNFTDAGEHEFPANNQSVSGNNASPFRMPTVGRSRTPSSRREERNIDIGPGDNQQRRQQLYPDHTQSGDRRYHGFEQNREDPVAQALDLHEDIRRILDNMSDEDYDRYVKARRRGRGG